jgi:sugar lactone lactonase YvrE
MFLQSGGNVPSRQRVLRGLVHLGLVFGGAGQARSQFLYFCDGYNIGRASLDGSGQTTLVSGLAGGPVGPVLDLAGGQMYWTNVFAGTIQRADLDGSGLTTIVSGLNAPGFPALDLIGRTIYWPETPSGASPGAIRRANLDGTEVVTLVSGLNQPRGIALDLAGGRMYWTDYGGDIERANLDGTGQTTLVSGVSSPNAVALDITRGKMYWTDFGSIIARANLDGSGQEILVQNLRGPNGIALDLADGLMYWADFGGGDIRRANLDRSGQQTLIPRVTVGIGVALGLGAPGTDAFFAVAAPASVRSGTPFDVTVTALDLYGNPAAQYQGTVTFSTSDTDPGIVLPADYVFTADDHGVHTFPGAVTLSTPGDQTITVTDTASAMTRSVTITVVSPN